MGGGGGSAKLSENGPPLNVGQGRAGQGGATGVCGWLESGAHGWGVCDCLLFSALGFLFLSSSFTGWLWACGTWVFMDSPRGLRTKLTSFENYRPLLH